MAMVVIGVTGGVGTGKSTVADLFHAFGAAVLDADAIAHELMEPTGLVWRKIVQAFGEEVLNRDGTINRARLASIVFSDRKRRRELEAIVHPQVLRRITQALRRLRSLEAPRRVRAVVLDIPLLVETGTQRMVDVLVVVTAPPKIQRERLQRQHGWSDEEVSRRVAAQWGVSAKAALADYVVDNGDGRGATRTQVKRIWNRLLGVTR